MNEQPLFSVLIANYNNGKYLMEAIESVRMQTYSNWEIILVDDGSTDNSHELYKELENDPRIHIYYNEQNMGCGYTKHKCALNANGEYCGYLDPDDVILPNALSEISGHLSRNPKSSLCLSRFYVCDEKMNIIRESRPLILEKGESYFEHHDYRAETFAGFRKDSYILMGGIDTSLKAGVDADLYFRLEEVGELEISHELTYKYRIFPQSITGNWQKAFYWNLILRHNTCVRRGLPIEQFSYLDFLNYISYSHWETRAYRIGKLILNPKSWLTFKKKYHNTFDTK